MWIGEIDFPANLIDAHKSGELVLFVGAGASIDGPSNLPLFGELTQLVLEDASMAPATSKDCDAVLGRAAASGVAVHQLVAARIGIKESRPNKLHKAITDLAFAGGEVRIVTTNYDLHLSKELKGGRKMRLFAEHAGPALPMGDDFSGVAYLHGNLRQESRRLVVTDADFGRAYLLDAWAARFLERMFRRYVVLFVGYSHEDVVMKYMARALGGGMSRYVLTDKPDDEKWKQLGITAIGYPVNEAGSHLALTTALAKWTARAQMGLLDHGERIRQIVAGSPTLAPEEQSYMESVVADATLVHHFAAHARRIEWLDWAASRPEFARLFQFDQAPEPCADELARWFCEHFAFAEDFSHKALDVVAVAGGRIGPHLWSAIGQSLLASNLEQRPRFHNAWILRLLDNVPRSTSDLLNQLLHSARWLDDRDIALLLFDFLTEPQLCLSSWSGDKVRHQLELRGSDDWLPRCWNRVFVPWLNEAAKEILPVAERHLRKAHRLQQSVTDLSQSLDPLSLGRPSISAHSQNSAGRSVNVLIDAARDSLGQLIQQNDPSSSAYIDRWARSEVLILQRLAMWGWSQRCDISADARLLWLRESALVSDYRFHREVFELLAVAMPTASIEVADLIIADIVENKQEAGGPGEDAVEIDYRAYERFNVLSWIVAVAPHLSSAGSALEEIHRKHPEFQVRENPELLSWTSFGSYGPNPPMSPLEFHELIAADGPGAIQKIASYRDKNFSLSEPTWSDALALVSETVSLYPTDGFLIMDSVNDVEIYKSVIAGWAKAANDEEAAPLILHRLETLSRDAPNIYGDEISLLLVEQMSGAGAPKDWSDYKESRQLAAQLWNSTAEETGLVGMGALVEAINTTSGRLGRFWTRATSANWQRAGESWTGLPSAICEQLEIMLSGSGAAKAHAQVVLTSQIHFYFSADRSWTVDHLLPLFRWSDAATAKRAWDGHLTWGRWTDSLLDSGLLDLYLETFAHIDLLTGDGREQLHAHVADIAISSGVPRDAWLRELTARASLDDRVGWLKRVTWRLHQLTNSEVGEQWTRWIYSYLTDRIASKPLPFEPQEATAIAPVVARLRGEKFREGVALFEKTEAGIAEHSPVLADLLADDSGSLETARFAAHLLENTSLPFWGVDDLGELFRKLQSSGVGKGDMQRIRESATRLGSTAAANW
jgi:SIR2-like domain/Domain of unknown function (DUF4020)